MPFSFKKLELEGVVVVEPRVFSDPRGFFMESYKKSDFAANGIPYDFVQDNHSMSSKNVIRGLHFQKNPKQQGKLVRVVSGAVLDFFVDLRKNSKTFLKYQNIELSSDNRRMVFIPPGFAHGFLALTDGVHLLYKCTAEFDIKLDSGVRWNDPDIGVDWGISDPLVSEKDVTLPFLKDINLAEL